VLVKTFGSAVYGIEAITITVEVNIAPGTKYFVVGLPDVAIKESYFRIESALKNCGYRMPRQQVVVNMAPADIKKEGSAYDLTIATGVLAASGQIETENLDKYLIMGELSLDGGLQPIKGALPIAIQARKEKYKGFILPKQNAREAAIVNDLEVYGVENIKQVADFFNGTPNSYKKLLTPAMSFTTALPLMTATLAKYADRKILSVL
jgi:magnesium chelatase family protein